jgi:hypothetical protein
MVVTAAGDVYQYEPNRRDTTNDGEENLQPQRSLAVRSLRHFT